MQDSTTTREMHFYRRGKQFKYDGNTKSVGKIKVIENFAQYEQIRQL